MDSEEPNHGGDIHNRHNTVTENSDTIAIQKKRARRVSFAEMTSVHFFDRDDEESNNTPAKFSDEFVGDEDDEKDDNEDDEMEMRSSFLRPIGSPSSGGSTVGSASSNDEDKDHFFGPVSSDFIRPGRLSDSAASDDNHDVTMDSTAFSMHYRSLARSESGVDKTPTGGGQLLFEEKTPTNANTSSMSFTLGKKPIPSSSVPDVDISASHNSNDMSLVGEKYNKYDFEKLSPRLDAIVTETKKSFFSVSISDDVIEKSSVPKEGEIFQSADDGDNIVSLSDNVRKEQGLINSREAPNGKVSTDHIVSDETNGPIGTFPTEHSPKDVSSSIFGVAALNADEYIANRSPYQLSKDESETSFVASTSSVRCRQIFPTNASPSKRLRVETPLLQQPGSLMRNGSVEHHDAETSIQKSISKLESLENSAFSNTFSARVDKSTIKSLDFLKSPNFDTNLEKSGHFLTSESSSGDALMTRTVSLLAEIASGDGGRAMLTPPKFVSTPSRMLEKNLPGSPGLQSSQSKNLITPAKENKSHVMHSEIPEVDNPAIRDVSMFEENLNGGDFRAISHGSVSPSSRRNLNESGLQKSYQNLVELPTASPSRNELDNRPSPRILSPEFIQLTSRRENLATKKRNVELLLKDTEHTTEMTIMQRSPKLQKGENFDQGTLLYPNEGSTTVSGHQRKKWTDIHSKLSEDTKELIPGSANLLNIKMIDELQDMLVHLQRSETYKMLRNEVVPQNTAVPNLLQLEKVAETKSLLRRVVFEKAKLQLKLIKREKLLERSKLLCSRIQESQVLGKNILLRPLEERTPSGPVVVGDLSLSAILDKDDKVCNGNLTSMEQDSEALDSSILNLKRTFHTRLKTKADLSHDETVSLVNKHLMKKASCRSIHMAMQMWVVQSVHSVNGQPNVVLNYLDFIIQSIKVIIGTTSNASISFKLNEANIIKDFPNMDACTAFAFVFNDENVLKYIDAKTLAQATQVSSSLLGTLLDVVEEVQSAQIEFLNLTQTSFRSPSAEQLILLLTFFHFNTGRKVILTLDVSCLKRGIYPSEVLPLELTSPNGDQKRSFPGPNFGQIRDAVKGVRSGYMRILRLCMCVSQAVQASNA